MMVDKKVTNDDLDKLEAGGYLRKSEIKMEPPLSPSPKNKLLNRR